MEEHLNAVSFLYKILGVFWIIIAILVVAAVVLAMWFVAYQESVPMAILVLIIGALASFLMAVYGVFCVVASNAFREKKSWARIAIIVLSILTLFANIPYGTAIGIYGLWVCLSSKTAHLFAG